MYEHFYFQIGGPFRLQELGCMVSYTSTTCMCYKRLYIAINPYIFCFRVMMGAFPMYIPDNPAPAKKTAKEKD